MAEIVYALCAATSVLCAALLVRSYLKNRTPLLLWSAICFCGLAANGALLFLDLVILPTTVDLSPVRGVVAALAMACMVIGLIWSRGEP